MNNCLNCGAQLRPNAKFCTKCGATTKPIQVSNLCTNPSCKRHIEKFQFNPDELHCDECGSFTEVGKKIDELT